MQRQGANHNTPPIRSLTADDLMMPLTPPPTDVRNVSEERVAVDDHDRSRYQTTADGDVRTIVVQPSFGTVDAFSLKQGNHPVSESSKEQDPAAMSPDRRDGAPMTQSTESADVVSEGRGHARNLSSQFYEGLRFSEQGIYPVQQASSRVQNPSELSPHVETDVAKPEMPPPGEDPAMEPPSPPSAGQKHHRGHSEDMLNPPNAHRRMNSTGNSVQVDRSMAPYEERRPVHAPPRGAHHRRTSSGLDMLSAAATVSKEDLAVAAGARGAPAVSAPWEPPSSETQMPQRSSPVEAQFRMSPSAVSAGSYDYSRHGQPPAYGGPRHHQIPQARPSGYQGPPPSGPYHGHPPTSYHPQAHYYHPGLPPPPSYHHQRGMLQRHPTSHPVQYAPSRGASGASYHKGAFQAAPLPQQPMLHSPPPEQLAQANGGRVENDMHPWRNLPLLEHSGVTTGAQTMVTAIDVGDGNKVIHSAPITRTASTNTDPGAAINPPAPIPSSVSHHQRMPSFGSLSTMIGSAGVFPDRQVAGAGHPKPTPQPDPSRKGRHHRSTSSSISFLLEDKQKGHHRKTSSTASFLNYLEDQPLTNEAFMQAVAAPGPVGAYPPHGAHPGYGYSPVRSQAHGYGRGPPPQAIAEMSTVCQPVSKLATGGTSKRVRRKCIVEGCGNRVVQGGLCISHGAKRKHCKHPGCTKNVKKAGLCSAHGPARKRCETEGCNKVAVQGGRCIAHGAKKKLCTREGCQKQAILAGMCKKHHDLSLPPAQRQAQLPMPSHTRGLSIFQEITPDTVQDLLNPPPATGNY